MNGRCAVMAGFFCALLVGVSVVAFAGDANSVSPAPDEPRADFNADRRAGDDMIPPRLMPPEASTRIGASYDPEDTRGKKIKFVGIVSITGNEPHTLVIVRPEGQGMTYLITPREAASDLSAAQNKRIAIEAIIVDGDSIGRRDVPGQSDGGKRIGGIAGIDAAIRVLSWKIVK